MENKKLENLLCSVVAGNDFENTQFENHLSIFVHCLIICQAVATLKWHSSVFHSFMVSLPFLFGHPSNF